MGFESLLKGRVRTGIAAAREIKSAVEQGIAEAKAEQARKAEEEARLAEEEARRKEEEARIAAEQQAAQEIQEAEEQARDEGALRTIVIVLTVLLAVLVAAGVVRSLGKQKARRR